MKSFDRVAFQGDIALIRIAHVPRGAKRRPKTERHVIAHSETGHDHFIASKMGVVFDDPTNPLICYLRLGADADLVHARSYDTHETIRVKKGAYKIVRQREYTPEGWRRVED